MMNASRIFLHQLLSLFLYCNLSLAQGQNLRGTDLRMVGETLNFEVYGIKNWDYDVKKTVLDGKTIVTLKLGEISDSDLQ